MVETVTPKVPTRDSDRMTSFTGFHPVQGLRLASRALARVPGTAAVAVLTIGIGLSTAVVILGILEGATRPLPVPRGDEIVQIRLLDARGHVTAAPAPLAEWTSGAGIAEIGLARKIDARIRHQGAAP